MNRIWHNSYPDNIPYEIQTQNLSLYQLLERSASDYPTRKAVIDNDQEVTYSELKVMCDYFAASLYRRGLKKGDRIGIMLSNSLEYAIAYYAIHRLGGIVVQVNPMYQPDELDFLLQNAEASWLICKKEQMWKLQKSEFLDKLKVVEVDGNKGEENAFYECIAEKNTELPTLDIDPKEDVAVLQYTGGTTGKPKGTMLTHSNLISNANQNATFYKMQQGNECIIGTPPVFHAMGMGFLNITVYLSGTYIAIARFNVDILLELIRKHRPTIFPGVPTMYVALLQHPNLMEDDLKSLRICTCGSAPLPIEVIRKFEQKSGAMVLDGYGLTEASSTVQRNPINGKRKIGSIGVPLPSTDCKVVDIETGTQELPLGEAGELIVKGPQIMKGYWKNDAETKQAKRDGWLFTGDIAIMDADGFFRIVGRKKDMIIASGYNIYPIEIEEVLYQHPGVLEACVFGVPDAYRGETVKAVIVPKKDITKKEIEAWCTERLARYKVPRLIEFKQELPKSTVGKILRRKLVEQERQKLKQEPE